MDTKPIPSEQSRRQFLKSLACSGLALLGTSSIISACSPSSTEPPSTDPTQSPEQVESTQTRALPADNEQWTPPKAYQGDLPQGAGSVRIPGRGRVEFDAGQIQTTRPELFVEGHFSLFDVLAHQSRQGRIDMAYHWDAELDTHVIDQIDGKENWWYKAYYAAGWSETNVFRMDMYPYKNGTTFELEFSGDAVTYARFKWWCHLPDCWLDLGQIAAEIVRLADLPEWWNHSEKYLCPAK